MYKRDQAFIKGLFKGIEKRLDAHDKRFDAIDARFGQADGRFEKIDTHFDKIESRFDRIESELHRHGILLERQKDQLCLVAQGVISLDRRVEHLEVDVAGIKKMLISYPVALEMVKRHDVLLAKLNS